MNKLKKYNKPKLRVHGNINKITTKITGKKDGKFQKS